MFLMTIFSSAPQETLAEIPSKNPPALTGSPGLGSWAAGGNGNHALNGLVKTHDGQVFVRVTG